MTPAELTAAIADQRLLIDKAVFTRGGWDSVAAALPVTEAAALERTRFSDNYPDLVELRRRIEALP